MESEKEKNNKNKKNIERQTAYKMWVKDIIKSKYVKTPGEWEPNYILDRLGNKVSRVNLFGSVVFVDDQQTMLSMTVDDGTDKINIRSFDQARNLKKPAIGSIIQIIGKPREFGNEIYIIPEIIKEIKDIEWVELRRLELKKIYPVESLEEEEKKEVPEEEIAAEEEIDATNEIDKIILTIKSLDKGQGANIEEVIQKVKGNSEKIIKDLIERGEVFEIKPGQVKVLE